MIDWWNGPLSLVFLFALCLLLLTWSIAVIACRACHSSGTFFHCDTRTRVVGAAVSFTDLDFRLHRYLSLFLGRNLFYIEFFFSSEVVHELEFFLFFFPRRVTRVEVCVRTNCHVGQGANVSNACEWACGRGENFFFCLYSSVYVRVWLNARLLWRLFWNVRRSWRSFRRIRQSASFSLLLLFFPLCTGPGAHCHP